MRDSFTGLYAKVRGKRSYDRVLYRWVGKRRFLELRARTADRRELLSATSRLLNRSEQDLVDVLASELDMPSISSIPEIPQSCLKTFDLEKWRSAGALPYFVGEVLSGVACVDPKLARASLTEALSLPLILAPWSLMKHMSATAAPNVVVCDSLLQSMLEYVLKEAMGKNAHSVLFHFDPNKPTYSFPVKHGRRATGDLSTEVIQPLSAYLSSLGASLYFSALEWRIRHHARSNEFLVEQTSRTGESADDTSLPVPTNVVEFPQGLGPAEGAVDERSTSSSMKTVPHSGDRILLIDDNVTFTRVLRRYLDRISVECVIADDTAEAMKILRGRNSAIGLVICDVHMPRESGATFLTKIRASSELAHLPVVMLTSDDEIELQIQLFSSGADAFVKKCDDPRLLCAHVQRLLSMRTQRKVA